MKKILLGTSGLIAAALVVSSPASAAEKIKLGLGGYMEQWIGFADQDNLYSAFNEFDQQSDSEIYFVGSTKLDNGITVGVHVQLEGERNAGPRWIDDSWLFLTSEQMGTLHLGSATAATFAVHHASPDFNPVQAGITYADARNWIATSNGLFPLGTAFFSDSHKIQYISPSFSGFQFGGMYIPDVQDGGNSMPLNTTSSFAGALVAYNGDFDGVKVGFDAAYGTSENDTDGYQLGLSVAFDGFYIGGGYWAMDDFDGLWDLKGIGGEQTQYDIGAAYTSGPFTLSLTWFHGELDRTGTNDDESEIIMGSVRYVMGPGVDLKGSIFHQSAESGGVDDGDGWAAVGGLRISF
ncbi:MAG: porin [Magnetospiraceae bacterium]